jgi:hypothetical protein
MRSWGIIGLGTLVILAQGCGTHQHRRMGMDLDHREAISEGMFSQAMPASLGHLAVDSTVLGDSDASTVECKKEYRFSRESFDRVLVEILRETGGFQSVRLLGSGPGDAMDLRTRPDLLLRMELESQSLTFRERNSSNLLGIILWLLPPCIEAQWIHDEDYGLQFRGRGLILDPESQEVIQEIHLGQCSAVDSLNFHERTSSIGPYLLTFFVPPTAVGSDPDALMEALLPQALNGALGRLREGFRAVASPEARGIRIETTPSDLVSFEVTSPASGAEIETESVDIHLDLVFGQDSRNLSEVRINDEVLIRYRDRRHRPIQEKIPVTKEGVPFVDGVITISVYLDTQIEPVEARIYRP